MAWPIRTSYAELKPASWFLSHPLNFRVSNSQLDEYLAASLDELGWIKPVIVNRRTSPDWGENQGVDTLLDGHKRIRCALRAGEETPVPLDWVDLSPALEPIALMLLDEMTTYGSKDRETLALLMQETKPANAALQQMCTRMCEESGIATLYGHDVAAVEDIEPQLDRAVELQEQWGTAVGQLWDIPSLTVPGKSHRLLCGDCTSSEIIEKLIDDDIALCVTSPPYSDQRAYHQEVLDWTALMIGMSKCLWALWPRHVLINLGIVHRERAVDFYWNKWLDFCAQEDWPLFGWYVWDKGKALPGEWNGRLAMAHEFVFHFNRETDRANKWVRTHTKAKGSHTFRQRDGSLRQATSPDTIGQAFKIPDSVIRANPYIGANIGHPAVMGLELAEFCLRTWSDPDDICYEPFWGAGTTAVAAEQLGRICYGCEISPAYVAVSLQRMSDLGLTPRLVESSLPHA